MFTYGIKVEKARDPVRMYLIPTSYLNFANSSRIKYITNAEEAIEKALRLAHPGSTLVDILPIRMPIIS